MTAVKYIKEVTKRIQFTTANPRAQSPLKSTAAPSLSKSSRLRLSISTTMFIKSAVKSLQLPADSFNKNPIS